MINQIGRLFTGGPKLRQKPQQNNNTDVHELVSLDGIDHIRIDNRAKTLLGRMMDSQYISPFLHPKLGPFNTTEGFWFYISMEKPDERLRQLNGHECRKLIRELRDKGQLTRCWVNHFDRHISYANWLKITSNAQLLRALQSSKLPFRMYYVLETEGTAKLIESEKLFWVITVLEDVRAKVKIAGNISEMINPYEMEDHLYNEILERIPKEVRDIYQI